MLENKQGGVNICDKKSTGSINTSHALGSNFTLGMKFLVGDIGLGQNFVSSVRF